MDRDIEAYHKSITAEFDSTKDRIRHLIGDRHWSTDGTHKEAVFRKVARSFCPDTYRIGSGFVCHPSDGANVHARITSTQLDVLVTDSNKPTLFRDGELFIVTPDSVAAIIEVKTRLRDAGNLAEPLAKLGDAISDVRLRQKGREVWAGLFAFDDGDPNVTVADHEDASLEDQARLQSGLMKMQAASTSDKLRAINCLAWGKHYFFRYWPKGSNVDNPITENFDVWHSYYLSNLAQGYFLSNLVHALGNVPDDMQFAWFPKEGGKESKRTGYVTLDGSNSALFIP